MKTNLREEAWSASTLAGSGNMGGCTLEPQEEGWYFQSAACSKSPVPSSCRLSVKRRAAETFSLSHTHTYTQHTHAQHNARACTHTHCQCWYTVGKLNIATYTVHCKHSLKKQQRDSHQLEGIRSAIERIPKDSSIPALSKNVLFADVLRRWKVLEAAIQNSHILHVQKCTRIILEPFLSVCLSKFS